MNLYKFKVDVFALGITADVRVRTLTVVPGLPKLTISHIQILKVNHIVDLSTIHYSSA